MAWRVVLCALVIAGVLSACNTRTSENDEALRLPVPTPPPPPPPIDAAPAQPLPPPPPPPPPPIVETDDEQATKAEQDRLEALARADDDRVKYKDKDPPKKKKRKREPGSSTADVDDPLGLGTVDTRGMGAGAGKGGYGAGADFGLDPKGVRTPTMKIDELTVDGQRDVVRRMLMRHASRLRMCYERRLLVDPNLTGKVVASFGIDAQGATTAVSASGLDAEIEKCLTRALEGVTFPSPTDGEEIQVRTVLRFEPG